MKVRWDALLEVLDGCSAEPGSRLPGWSSLAISEVVGWPLGTFEKPTTSSSRSRQHSPVVREELIVFSMHSATRF